MTKPKLYNPDKCGTFKMMFGFEQPIQVILYKRKKIINENNTDYRRTSQKSV